MPGSSKYSNAKFDHWVEVLTARPLVIRYVTPCVIGINKYLWSEILAVWFVI